MNDKNDKIQSIVSIGINIDNFMNINAMFKNVQSLAHIF